MQYARPAGCTCERVDPNSAQPCPVCAQLRLKRVQQHTYSRDERPSSRMTPPPSQPSSPRRSREASIAHPSQRAVVGETFTRALSTDEECPSLLPSSLFYRPSNRSTGASRRTSECSASSSNVSTPSLQPMGSADYYGRHLSRSATPDAKYSANAYAPMAAGFARLSRRSVDSGARTSSDMGGHGRASSARSSLDLGARMFNGPA